MFDVQKLLVGLAIILILARLLGALARKLGQPPVVGEIVAGILLGPTFFAGDIGRHLFNIGAVADPKTPADLTPVLTGIADVGLVLFMFIVGYELDRTLIKGRERIAASVSLGSIVVPMVAGFFLGLWLAMHNDDIKKDSVAVALFVGAAMSVTAFPVLARILTDRGLHRTRIGGLAVASAAVDDIAAWSLLAVVVTIAGGSGEDTWHILLAPVYLAVMALVVRPLLKMVGDRFRDANRLTPDVLAVVLVTLLLSSYATEWLGVHFIFGAFIAGAVMPREDGERLRVAILERLEQVSVLLLLPVFFVVSGLKVDLSKIDGDKFVELLAILGVAIGGKFLGAYLGGRSAGVGSRQASVLATLMNTRGLTEIVILNVGLQNGVLGPSLFTLMVVMALVTTVMTGPLLRLVYPPRLVRRDLADAERAALAESSAYRVLVVCESADDADMVDTALDIASARKPAQVVLSRLLPQKQSERIELGAGLGMDLLVMTQSLSELHALAERGASRDIEVAVYSQFSDDLAQDLTRYVINADPAFVVVPASVQLAPHELMPRTVVRRLELPAEPSAVALHRSQAGTDSDVALQIAAQIAVGRQLGLVLVGGNPRRDKGVIAEMDKHGVTATIGELPPRAIVIGTETDLDAHLVVHARPDDEADKVEEWLSLVTAERQS